MIKVSEMKNSHCAGRGYYKDVVNVLMKSLERATEDYVFRRQSETVQT